MEGLHEAARVHHYAWQCSGDHSLAACRARATASGALPVIGFLDAGSAAERTAQVGPAVAQRADVAEPA